MRKQRSTKEPIHISEIVYKVLLVAKMAGKASPRTLPDIFTGIYINRRNIRQLQSQNGLQ